MDYSKEPELIFTQIDDERYAIFYDLELLNFQEDNTFYLNAINPSQNILELGCGSGRLTHLLAQVPANIVALDKSFIMLARAATHQSDRVHYTCMDMCCFDFSTLFDTIIIPYNTLNLLGSSHHVQQCLQLCHKHLKKKGKLVMQLYVPDKEISKTEGKTFQFQIFEPPTGGKLIKETIKEYRKDTATTILEERYRIRPFQNGVPNEDLNNILTLFTPNYRNWKTLLEASGFSINAQYGDYTLSSFTPESDSCLLLEAGKR